MGSSGYSHLEVKGGKRLKNWTLSMLPLSIIIVAPDLKKLVR